MSVKHLKYYSNWSMAFGRTPNPIAVDLEENEVQLQLFNTLETEMKLLCFITLWHNKVHTTVIMNHHYITAVICLFYFHISNCKDIVDGNQGPNNNIIPDTFYLYICFHLTGFGFILTCFLLFSRACPLWFCKKNKEVKMFFFIVKVFWSLDGRNDNKKSFFSSI